MELRLFIVACIMYAFTLITRKISKMEHFKNPIIFGLWHFVFLLLILSCALFIFLFVMGGGAGGLFPFDKFLIGEVIVLGVAIYGFIAMQKADAAKQEKTLKSDLDWSNTVYFAGFVASIVMFFFLQAFKIPSASMRNTLMEGDHLFVNKAAYGLHIPFTDKYIKAKDVKVGDIIVFKFPARDRKQLNCGGQTQYGRDFVKRVVALPGDKVEIKDGHLWVNDEAVPQQPYELYTDKFRVTDIENDDPKLYQKLWQEHKLDSYIGSELKDVFGPVTVPANNYFVMGDNRDNSCDSRFWGPVPRKNIRGKAWFIHWPSKKSGFIK